MIERVKNKIEAVQSFSKSEKMLLTIKPLNQNRREQFLQNDYLPINETCYFLNAVIFELLIKIFYELETNKVCEKTHNLKKIYDKLSDTNKKFIRDEYQKVKNKLKKDMSQADITYCNLNEALKQNHKIVTDFKYKMQIDLKNVAFYNLVVNNGTIFVVPNMLYEIFFNNLLKRAQSIKAKNEVVA